MEPPVVYFEKNYIVFSFFLSVNLVLLWCVVFLGGGWGGEFVYASILVTHLMIQEWFWTILLRCQRAVITTPPGLSLKNCFHIHFYSYFIHWLYFSQSIFGVILFYIPMPAHCLSASLYLNSVHSWD